eukprot:CAMPEP_0115424106 /NCGR_PEP_ID=MMETSP0271-20121206/27662_1 /TAXON_ID=71861 /ORGANISM="Scrippsiella trochoidea, Strain CCMP3099" /LENGTH=109 /DNA_ID=CAMNT_0002848901 /DNA_START=106 /DNA_END=432 /DNA_ORIENTATION=-
MAIRAAMSTASTSLSFTPAAARLELVSSDSPSCVASPSGASVAWVSSVIFCFVSVLFSDTSAREWPARKDGVEVSPAATARRITTLRVVARIVECMVRAAEPIKVRRLE